MDGVDVKVVSTAERKGDGFENACGGVAVKRVASFADRDIVFSKLPEWAARLDSRAP